MNPALDFIARSSLVDQAAALRLTGARVYYFEELADVLAWATPRVGRAILPLFDAAFYVAHNGLAIEPVAAFRHFWQNGIGQGYSPHPLVDLPFMRARRPELFAEPNLPLLLVAIVERNLVDPSPYFDIAHYRRAAGMGDATVSALLHFLREGDAHGHSPLPWFAPQAYAAQYPDVPAAPVEALLHFARVGDRARRVPGGRFDPDWYMARYQPATDRPLYHFCAEGRAAGHLPSPSGGAVGGDGAGHGGAFAASLAVDEDADTLLLNHGAIRDRLAERQRMRIEAVVEYPALPVPGDDVDVLIAGLRFEPVAAPLVDVILPAYDGYELTVQCLASIARARPRCAIRILLADDASPDPRMGRLAGIDGIEYVRHPHNLHFLRSCNAVYRRCTAKYVLLLNNDTQVAEGALDALVDALEADVGLAAAAPRLLYPSGRLQEAGCRFNADGSTELVGLAEDAADPRYGFPRDVQYASGACLLLRRERVGDTLFDERFAPAYCEDADLCLRLVADGGRIRYVPSAVVYHHLSATTGRESETRRRQGAIANQAKLYAKWAGFLAEQRRVRALAFYLPQFHPVPQNDLWWGKGFTDWTNVAKARPGFVGHYQPQLPADLGFYDLRLPAVMAEQQRLARRYGVEGFVLYHYDFNGTRLLDTPLRNLLADPSIDFRFALCWANENWTRHWDGGEREPLMTQDYDDASLDRMLDDFVAAASDVRYIHVEGRPLLLVYRPLLVPDLAAFVNRVRSRFILSGLADPYLLYVESMETSAKGVVPSGIGFDASVEFPPQGVAVRDTAPREALRPDWDGAVYDYAATVVNASDVRVPYLRHPCVFPGWDNTPRQPAKGTVLQGASPERFQAYVEARLDEVDGMFVGERRLLFVNAWNEWAEGAHLEPDTVYGHRWLAALHAAMLGDGVLG